MELLHPQLEYYVAIAMDQTAMGPVVMASREGGVDIEEVAKNNPDAIVKEEVDPLEGTRTHAHMLLVYYVCPPAWCSTSLPRPPAPPPPSGLTEEKAARVASSLGFTGSYHEQAVDQLVKLYHVFTEYDATMVEINPLTEDSNGKGKHRHCTSVGWGVRVHQRTCGRLCPQQHWL